MIDITISNKSKNAVERGRELGFNRLIFAQYYEPHLNFGLVDAVIVSTFDLSEMRKQIDRIHARGKRVIVEGCGESINRAALESKKVWMLLSPEKNAKHGSGLNHVLCEIARGKGILIGINLSELQKKQGKEKALLISKVMQNVKLCRKYKANILPLSCASNKDEMLPPQQIKNFATALNFTSEQIKSFWEYP